MTRRRGLPPLGLAALLLASLGLACAPYLHDLPDARESRPIASPPRAVAQRESALADVSAPPLMPLVPTTSPTPTPAPSPTPAPTPTPLPPPAASPALRAALSPVPSPVPSPTWAGLPVDASVDVPVLMYHRISTPPRNADAVRIDLSVPPSGFQAHVDMLRRLGVVSVSLDDVIDFLAGRRPPPPRAAVLTFDDGYDDNYLFAYPILRSAGMTGTVYVITELVGHPGYLTWDQLREMAAAGWTIGSHTETHADLRFEPDDALRSELRESRVRMERELGRPVWHLAYPSGRYDARVLAAAARAGYRTAVTTNPGTRLAAAQALELPRVRVRGWDTAQSLLERLPPRIWR